MKVALRCVGRVGRLLHIYTALGKTTVRSEYLVFYINPPTTNKSLKKIRIVKVVAVHAEKLKLRQSAQQTGRRAH